MIFDCRKVYLFVIDDAVMFLSCSAKKGTKEGGLRRRFEKAPSLRILPPPHYPTPENVPIFGRLPGENLQVFEM